MDHVVGGTGREHFNANHAPCQRHRIQSNDGALDDAGPNQYPRWRAA